MTTYIIRQNRYADGGDLVDAPRSEPEHYVFTITEAGYAHHFADNLSAAEAATFAADLSKLAPESVARLVGDK